MNGALSHKSIKLPVLALLLVAFIFTLVPLEAFSSPGYQTETAPHTETNPNTQSSPNTIAQLLLDSATPEERVELEKVMAEIERLENETELASENYNASTARLERIRSDITTARERYELVSTAYEIQKKELGSRLADQYRSGGLRLLEILFSGQSFSESVQNLRYLLQMTESDSRLLRQVSDDKKQLEDTLNQLARDEKDAVSLEFELKARSIEVKERNARLTKSLEAQSSRIQQLIMATRSTEAAEESALALQISLGSLSSVQVVPGSPVETALAYRGIKYVWGGESPRGFDCSGLVLYVFNQHGVKLPHYSGSQFTYGVPVTDKLNPGDAVFFGRPIHHVGIYIGGDYYVHAPRTGDVVKISSLSRRKDYVGARRYNWEKRTEPIRMK